ncbi:MAG: preprotein translocase subunit SecB [Gammaproteobacteria bacterium]|jgi:preprotein translocase subunit SecB|nr:preprotein translocase subunit SecB [Gammaproteobacteria bacterium]
MSEQQTANQFQIHKLYTKELSFEIPNGSKAFQVEWAPELNLEISNTSKALAEANTHEVVLSIKCTVSSQNQTIFIAEAKQAGIFTLPAMEDELARHTLGAFCPNLLYPYLREVVSNLVVQGGFPQLALAPIDFNMMYEQQAKNQSAEKVN